MAYLEFKNGVTPINDTNLNSMQNSIETDINGKASGTILYKDSTGISGQNSLTLSQNISNFKKIEIVYDLSNTSNVDERYGKNMARQFDVSSSSSDLLISENINNAFYATMNISENTLSILRNRIVNSGLPSEGNYFIVTKVIGYK